MPLSRARTVLASLLVVAALGAGCSDDTSDSGKKDQSSAASAVETLVATGVSQLESGDTGAASGTFNSVLALDPENLLAHYNLGLIAQQREDAAAAISHYDQALAANGEYGPALYNKAILLETTDLEGAVELYREAIEAQPEFAPAHMRLGFALVHLDRTDEGEEHLEKGISLDPSMREVAAPDYE